MAGINRKSENVHHRKPCFNGQPPWLSGAILSLAGDFGGDKVLHKELENRRPKLSTHLPRVRRR